MLSNTLLRCYVVTRYTTFVFIPTRVPRSGFRTDGSSSESGLGQRKLTGQSRHLGREAVGADVGGEDIPERVVYRHPMDRARDSERRGHAVQGESRQPDTRAGSRPDGLTRCNLAES